MKTPYWILSALIASGLALTSCSKEDSSAETSTEPGNAASGTSKHEQYATEISDALEEVVKTVTTAKDKESTQKAVERIDEIGDRFADIAAKLEKMDPPSEETKKEITEKMEARDAKLQESMSAKIDQTLADLDEESQVMLMEAMGEFFQKMEEVGETFSEHYEVAEDEESQD